MEHPDVKRIRDSWSQALKELMEMITLLKFEVNKMHELKAENKALREELKEANSSVDFWRSQARKRRFDNN